MKRSLFLVIFIAVFLDSVRSDIYLHNPRGSNNRWNENSRARNNANRMFDSQNNARGGYNVGSLYYYVGSNLQIEWTNQHSCNDQNNHCDVILQYMCDDRLRDGTSTATIPDNPVNCKDLNCNGDGRYGMHEDFYSFAHCRLRSRNQGLFTADRNLKNTATSTRQNQNQNKYGYECPEEKDYYPYWGPTQWRDIAVLTNDVSRCQLYLNESQNVKPKYACNVGQAYLYQNANVKNSNNPIPITEEECKAFQYSDSGTQKNGTWQEYSSHGLPPPNCMESQSSRDNHLGNGLGGQTLSYNWTIPNLISEHCALRIRYNISTMDYDRDETVAASNNRNRRNDPGVDIWSRHGLSEAEGAARGYRLINDPEIDVFSTDKLKLQLAINTAQFGRTFQDRSHRFAIRRRPAELEDATIRNINVRGKRGNIVQVYPAVEYDYVPNTVVARNNFDYIHFQWTGSDNNPGTNDGQGRAGTDRSNVVLLTDAVYVEGQPEIYKTSTYGQLGSSYPAHLDSAIFGGLSPDDLSDLAILRDHLGGDMDELNDAGTYFDLRPRKVTRSGTYHYMCTRNNNFSNRSQKGKLIVTNSAYSQQRVDSNGGSVSIENSQTGITAMVEVPPAAFTSGKSLEIWEIAPEDLDVPSLPPQKDYVSSFLYLVPAEKLTESNYQIKVQIKLTGSASSLYQIAVYRSNPAVTSWSQLSIEDNSGGMVSFNTDSGGYFVATRSVAPGPVAGLVIGLLLAVALIAGIIVYLRKNEVLCANYKGKI